MLMLRYHPRSKLLNPQGLRLKTRNQWAIPLPLARALHSTFLTTCELFASPLNCAMGRGLSYCTAFPEDAAFGALHDAFSYR